ncbi:MAG: FAD:protein FMN transferase [Syntrophobacter sp.]
MERRDFIRASGIIALAGLAASHFTSPGSVLSRVPPNGRDASNVYTETRHCLGTLVDITVSVPESVTLNDVHRLLDKAFAEIDRLSGILSRHAASSHLYELNRRGLLEYPPSELSKLTETALDFARDTNGYFNPSIGPIINAIAHHDTNYSDIHSMAVNRTDWRKIQITDSGIQFLAEDMCITLDGIAKGYIVDRASDLLSGNGIDNHLINAGGDLTARGVAGPGKAWRIGIQDPHRQGRVFADFFHGISGQAIATSGNYVSLADPRRGYPHLIIPGTGKSPESILSMSVSAPTAIEADALATALFVMPLEDAVQYVSGNPEIGMLAILSNGTCRECGKWPKKTA